MRVQCGAICLIALFVDSSDQETGASKQLAAPLPYTHLLTALTQNAALVGLTNQTLGVFGQQKTPAQ